MAGQDAAAESFWRFSLMVYGRPGVADTLIRLQDQDGHNVNLILFGLWLGLSQATQINAVTLARAKAAIERLDQGVVAPLRQLRRGMKGTLDPDVQVLRRRVLALEIAAERCVQARLAASIVGRRKTVREGQAAAEANLRLILGSNAELAVSALLRQVDPRVGG